MLSAQALEFHSWLCRKFDISTSCQQFFEVAIEQEVHHQPPHISCIYLPFGWTLPLSDPVRTFTQLSLHGFRSGLGERESVLVGVAHHDAPAPSCPRTDDIVSAGKHRNGNFV